MAKVITLSRSTSLAQEVCLDEFMPDHDTLIHSRQESRMHRKLAYVFSEVSPNYLVFLFVTFSFHILPIIVLTNCRPWLDKSAIVVHVIDVLHVLHNLSSEDSSTCLISSQSAYLHVLDNLTSDAFPLVHQGTRMLSQRNRLCKSAKGGKSQDYPRGT